MRWVTGDDPFGESFREVDGKAVLSRKRRLEVKNDSADTGRRRI